MVAYRYATKVAFVKGAINTLAANVSVLVYALTDTGYTTPLVAYSDRELTTITNIVTDVNGIPETDFYLNNHPDCRWKSGTMTGEWATTQSRPGLQGPVSTVPGPAGPQGANGTNGLNGSNGATVKWATGLPLAIDDPVINPSGDLVKVTTAHTAGGSYDATKFSTPYDTAVTSLINTPTSATRVALDPIYAARVDDRGYSTLQAAVDATPVGGTLEIRRAWVITAAVTITKAMRITCARGGTVTTSGANTHGFNITSSGVTVDAVSMIGAGSGTAGTSAAIRAIGTEAAPIRDLVIRGCVIREFNKYAIEATSVRDFTISNNLIENIAYGAVMISSGVGGYVLSNTIKNLVQPTGFVNSYGIAMTRNGTVSLTLSPRSSDIVCSGNIIDGVTKWEAIDTHGGENLTITGNRITNAYIGIALVPGVNESGNDTYAPKNIIVSNNDIDSGKTDGTARSGIQLIGCITTVDNVVEYASGIITDNIVKNGGTENTSAQAAVFLQATRGSIVSKNRIVNGSPNGLNLSNNNVNVMVLDNIFVDVWTTSIATTACVYVPGAHQSGTIKGNRAVRADKTATVVHNRGLWVSSALTTDIELQYSDNHFKVCALPIIDSPTTQNFTENRMEARKISFYPGITPITRQAVAAAATDAATTQALVNDLRAKLILTGIISA